MSRNTNLLLKRRTATLEEKVLRDFEHYKENFGDSPYKHFKKETIVSPVFSLSKHTKHSVENLKKIKDV